MPDILPGFTWSNSLQRYRQLDTGRFVSRRDILGVMEAQTTGLESRLGALTQALADGQLSPAWYLEQASTELRRAHLQQRALGAGGWDRLTARDYGSVGRKLRDDYARLVTLAQGIQDGTVTLPQAMTRIQGYAGSARLEFMEAERQRQQADEGMALIEKRNLAVAEHCGDCLELHSRGWQPVGVLPLPGDGSTECGTHDRCTIVSRQVPVDDVGEWIGTRRG